MVFLKIANFGFKNSDEFDLMKEPLMTLCTFEWTGGIFSEKDSERDGAREYQLVDIQRK